MLYNDNNNDNNVCIYIYIHMYIQSYDPNLIEDLTSHSQIHAIYVNTCIKPQ